jgi:hypothetical protein
MFLEPFDKSGLREHILLLLNFVLVSNFQFYRFGFPCEWSWHLVQVRGSKQNIFLLVLRWKLIRAPKTLSMGLPPTRTVSIFKIFPPKQHLHETVVGFQFRAMTEAAKSLKVHKIAHFTKSRETIPLTM